MVHVVLGAVSDAVIIADQNLLITHFNPVAEKLFGYQAKDVIGKLVYDLIVPPRMKSEAVKGLKTFKANGDAPMIGEWAKTTARRTDNTEFPVELTITPFAEGFVGVVRTPSEQKM